MLLEIYSLRNAGLLESLLPAEVPGLRCGKPKGQLWGSGLQVAVVVAGTSDRGRVLPGPPVTLQQGDGESGMVVPICPFRSESELSGAHRCLSFYPHFE